jgi:hypothetical protein
MEDYTQEEFQLVILMYSCTCQNQINYEARAWKNYALWLEREVIRNSTDRYRAVRQRALYLRTIPKDARESIKRIVAQAKKQAYEEGEKHAEMISAAACKIGKETVRKRAYQEGIDAVEKELNKLEPFTSKEGQLGLLAESLKECGKIAISAARKGGKPC